MLSTSEILFFLPFIALAVGQYYLILQVRKAFRKPSPSQFTEAKVPRVLMVLSLKGADPELKSCLKRLCSQEYPNYCLRLVIDSPEDPAWPIVREFLDENAEVNCEVINLGNRQPTCSGKISGMLRGTEDLEGFDLVAFVDGDAQIEPFCLRRLAEGLAEPEVGVVTGNRWYVPQSARLGTLCCYTWNMYAVPMMIAAKIPWGGCMAVRAEDLQPGPLRDHLKRSFGEDSAIASFMRDQGKQTRFLPDLLVLNHEDCGMQQLYNFVIRQYLTVRLHNPHWKIVVAYNLIVSLLFSIAMLGSMIPNFYQNSFLAGLTITTLSSLALAITIQNKVRDRVRNIAGRSIFWVTPARFLVFLISIPTTMMINLLTTVQSLFTSEHVWRGLKYRFGGDPPIQVIEPKESRVHSVV
ncbi:MAG TPA: hypothetical protein DD473_14000 [Planctomycetaceae bacterium]|nr:hypothetical protein [Planctomycetaceae bacterium]